jgi:hypothetical protein
VAAPFIAALPIFAWESRYDSNQLGWSCPFCGAGQDNVTAVEEYGARMSRSLGSWLGAEGATARAAFVDSCHRHCGCSTGIADDARGLNPKQAFAVWYGSLWSVEERTQLWSQGGPSRSYPCGDCCTGECPSYQADGQPAQPTPPSPPAHDDAGSSATTTGGAKGSAPAAGTTPALTGSGAGAVIVAAVVALAAVAGLAYACKARVAGGSSAAAVEESIYVEPAPVSHDSAMAPVPVQ